MLAPNGQPFFPSHDDWETTYENTRKILERCTEHFEKAVGGKPLKFELHVGDSAVLAEMYGDFGKLVTGHLWIFMNDVLSMMRMPYRVRSVGCIVTNSTVLYCSIREETFEDIKLRTGEVG